MLHRRWLTQLQSDLPTTNRGRLSKRGNLARGRNRKSLLQAIDQALENLPVLFFDAHLASIGTGVIDGAASFSGSDRPPVFVDPVLNPLAALGEQTQKVVGLAVIRFASRLSGGALDFNGRPVQSHWGHGFPLTDIDRPRVAHAAAGCTRVQMTRAIREVLSDALHTLRPLRLSRLSVVPARVRRGVRVACATPVGQRGNVHFASLNWGFGVWRENDNVPNTTRTICARDEAQDHFCARSMNRQSRLSCDSTIATRAVRMGHLAHLQPATCPVTENQSGRGRLAARSTAGAIQWQTSNAICTLKTVWGSSKLCPQSSIAWATRY